MTYANSPIPVAGATATSATYQIDLTHYTCGNRKICVNGGYPPSAQLNYKVMSVDSIGNSAYQCNVLVSGTCTYVPYKNGQNYGCCCNPCPVTENIYCTISVPVSASATPTLTGGTVNCYPTDVKDCCNTTNCIGISTSLLVATTASSQATE